MDILKTAETIQSGAAGIYNRLFAIAAGGSLTPAARLTIDGKPFGTDAQSRIISINLTDKSGFEADELTVTLSDHDGRLAFPPISAEIRLFLGYKETGLVDKGSYKITELSWSGAPDTLTLTALAADVSDKFSEARERSWHKTDLKKNHRNHRRRTRLHPHRRQSLAKRKNRPRRPKQRIQRRLFKPLGRTVRRNRHREKRPPFVRIRR